ncbi:phage-related lysozyme [Neoconidiobolus thromboides FSU 785]|nr:phage-related lysozyme [Neoconidiobolus thromboides FSU 785]
MPAKATSNQGLELIKKFEGFRGNFYHDQVGAKTIGYGHACHGDGQNCAGVTEPLSEPQAMSLLKDDLRSREECVAGSLTTPLGGNSFSALVSYAFNVGCEAFKSSPVLSLVNQKRFGEAANALKAQCYISGLKLEDLVVRREAEASLFCLDGIC